MCFLIAIFERKICHCLKYIYVLALVMLAVFNAPCLYSTEKIVKLNYFHVQYKLHSPKLLLGKNHDYYDN